MREPKKDRSEFNKTQEDLEYLINKACFQEFGLVADGEVSNRLLTEALSLVKLTGIKSEDSTISAEERGNWYLLRRSAEKAVLLWQNNVERHNKSVELGTKYNLEDGSPICKEVTINGSENETK